MNNNNNLIGCCAIGTDLVEVKRFEKLDFRSRFARNIFTTKELKDCQSKNHPAESLAARFAAKEAVRKTIKKNLKFRQVEIVSNKKGAPEVYFPDKKNQKKYHCLLSLTHTKDLALATCLTINLEGEDEERKN